MAISLASAQHGGCWRVRKGTGELSVTDPAGERCGLPGVTVVVLSERPLEAVRKELL